MSWSYTKSDDTFPHKKNSIFGEQHAPKSKALDSLKSKPMGHSTKRWEEGLKKIKKEGWNSPKGNPESPRAKEIRENNTRSKANSLKIK